MKNLSKVFLWIGIVVSFIGFNILISELAKLFSIGGWLMLLIRILTVIPIVVGLISILKIDKVRSKKELLPYSILSIVFCSVLPGIFMLCIKEVDLKLNTYNGRSLLGAKASRRLGNTAVYIVLVLITLIWLFPFFGIVLESFRVETTAQVSYLWPKEFGFDNYIRLFKETDFFKWFINTGIMGVATALLQTIFVLSMSYVLSRLRFKGRKGLMNFLLILGMFPGFLTMLLIYKVFSDFGLTESMAPLGLIIVYCASSGMGYYVSKGFFDTIPKSLDEAARVDGATRFQVFYKLILPLSKPIVIYTILMGFMAPWGEFMLASYLIHENSQGMSVAVGMFEWLSKTNVNTHYTMFCAAGVIIAVPVTAVFLGLQKYYVEGVTGGAVKG